MTISNCLFSTVGTGRWAYITLDFRCGNALWIEKLPQATAF